VSGGADGRLGWWRARPTTLPQALALAGFLIVLIAFVGRLVLDEPWTQTLAFSIPFALVRLVFDVAHVREQDDR